MTSEQIEDLATAMARGDGATCFEPLHDDMAGQLERDAYRRRARVAVDHLKVAEFTIVNEPCPRCGLDDGRHNLAQHAVMSQAAVRMYADHHAQEQNDLEAR